MKYAENFIKELLPSISKPNLLLVLKSAEKIKLQKGEIITPKGEVPQHFYILKSGIARNYIVENNKEYIKSLYLSPDICGSLSALILQKPSNIITDCITDCELISFDYTHFKEETKSNLELSLLNNSVIEKIAMRYDERINDLTTLNATEYYLKLKKQIPNIDNLIQQYHIASYLNITPVQLSRIRKKLYATKG